MHGCAFRLSAVMAACVWLGFLVVGVLTGRMLIGGEEL
jgi:hypothetical protein